MSIICVWGQNLDKILEIQVLIVTTSSKNGILSKDFSGFFMCVCMVLFLVLLCPQPVITIFFQTKLLSYFF